ncbi:MAG: hypothetical protein ACR2NO_07715 [Chloroflexota bacterium]
MHFVLDQNFPIQATGLPWPQGIKLTPLYDFDRSLVANKDDWEVLLGLVNAGVDGFITNDDKMLSLAREMLVLQRSRMKLVVTVGVGHDPIRATGLIMVSLGQIALMGKGQRPAAQIYKLHPLELGKNTITPGQVIDRLAKARGVQPNRLIAMERAAMRERGANV